MNLYLLIFTLILTVSFVYGTVIDSECAVVRSLSSKISCDGSSGIGSDYNGHITSM